jgi:hypothetical protein
MFHDLSMDPWNKYINSYQNFKPAGQKDGAAWIHNPTMKNYSGK